MMKCLLLSLFAFTATLHSTLLAHAAEDLTVLPPLSGEAAESGLVYQSLQKRAHDAFAKRKEVYENIKTPEDCAAYQKRMKEFFPDSDRRVSRTDATESPRDRKAEGGWISGRECNL